jgi:hypothetical protein
MEGANMEKLDKIEVLITHECRANRIARGLHILLNDSAILHEEIDIDPETRQDILNACLKIGALKYEIRERIEELKNDIKREVKNDVP